MKITSDNFFRAFRALQRSLESVGVRMTPEAELHLEKHLQLGWLGARHEPLTLLDDEDAPVVLCPYNLNCDERYVTVITQRNGEHRCFDEELTRTFNDAIAQVL